MFDHRHHQAMFSGGGNTNVIIALDNNFLGIIIERGIHFRVGLESRNHGLNQESQIGQFDPLGFHERSDLTAIGHQIGHVGFIGNGEVRHLF